MAGHTGGAMPNGGYEGIIYMPCTAENNFVPEPPKEHADLVYLCFPNNPTGAVATREQLTRWVEYAHEHKALLLYDAPYEAYISEPEIPHSIYEIPARTTARSSSAASRKPAASRRALRLHRHAESVMAQTETAARCRSIRCGIVAGARKQTA
jgi:hypothetical protein